MFTQYTQGPDRDTAVRGALLWNAPVDFIDKLASPEEVVLRLRRLIGTTPDAIPFGRLERYSEGDDPRASLRVRIREIKDILGAALGVRFTAGELIINVRDRGYRLIPPRN